MNFGVIFVIYNNYANYYQHYDRYLSDIGKPLSRPLD